MWSALGIYPLTGTDVYFIGSPVVTSATLKFTQGTSYCGLLDHTFTLILGDLVITAYNNSKSNIFVKEVRLNNKNIDLKTSPFLHHTGKILYVFDCLVIPLSSPDIASGGNLEFWMSETATKYF